MKTKGQFAEVWEPERLALTLWGWLGAAKRTLDPDGRGLEPLQLHYLLNAQPVATNCESGLPLDCGQRQGLVTRCHFEPLSGRKQRQNDMPQLPN
jgi:hypothetical protein